MKLTRAVAASGILVATVALAACSSSSGSSTSPNSGGNSSSTTTSSSSSSSSSDISCFSGKLNAEGSSAQANAMASWITAYQKACTGATINYNPLGSGAGITALINKQVDFAGSDAALSATPGATASAAKGCGGNTALDLPMVGGPIAIGYNLKGVTSLTLTGPVLAEIFLGKITMWNDSAIAALNKGVKLPAEKITPFYRSDASGTTYNVERYLAATAPSVFKVTPNTDSSTANFAGQGKTGSQGVSQATKSTPGGIGYFEYSYAVQTGLSTVNIDNGSGAVQISPDAASAAINSAKLIGKGNDLTLNLDYATKTKGAYPITLVTYEVVCSKYASSSTATAVKDFLTYTVNAGQDDLKQQGYAPLPTTLQQKVAAAVKTIS